MGRWAIRDVRAVCGERIVYNATVLVDGAMLGVIQRCADAARDLQPPRRVGNVKIAGPYTMNLHRVT